MNSPDNFGIALANAEMGIVSIPIAAGSKSPPLVKWKRWQREIPSPELLRAWFKNTRVNIAIICSGMVVFDCENLAFAELVLAECGPTSHVLKTPRGVHLGYRKRQGAQVMNNVKIKGMDIDIRTDGGLEMIPSSRTEYGEYSWLGAGLKPIAELPVAKIGWTRERQRRRVQSAIVPGDPHSIIGRGRAYIDTFDQRAVDGQNGHTSLFVAALKIVSFVRKLGGGEREAWELLLHYNATKCDPPWDLSIPAELRALQHKLDDSLRLAK